MPECRFQLEISQFKTERKRYFTDTYVENTQPMVKPLASSPKSSHIAKFFADVRGPTHGPKSVWDVAARSVSRMVPLVLSVHVQLIGSLATCSCSQ